MAPSIHHWQIDAYAAQKKVAQLKEAQAAT
jgi:hypothetical protein